MEIINPFFLILIINFYLKNPEKHIITLSNPAILRNRITYFERIKNIRLNNVITSFILNFK